MGDEGGAGAKPGSAAPEPSDGDPTAGEDDDNRAHAIELYDDRHSLEGKIRPDLQNAAWKQFSEMGTLTNQLPSGLPFARWVPLGPGPSLTLQGSQGYRLEGGTVWDIAIDPAVGADGATDQVMYLATEGGIWKTLDGGASWLPKTSRLGVQWFGAVALDVADTNTVYAGSGSTYHALGNGLYKSSDGGSHWKGPFAQAELTGKAVTRIVSPARNVLLVSARDDRNQAGLLLRSTDGGESFVRVSIPDFPSNSGPISDLHLSTASSDEVFVAIHGKGIFRSTDAGASFTSNLFSGSGAPEPDTYRWVTFAQGGRANSAVFYAAVAVQVGMQGEPKRKDDVVLYKSNDAGGSWSKLSNFKGDIPWFQSGHAQTIGVDPDDVNNVFVGLESAFVSADGGQTFTVIRESELHPDHHAITYSPTRGRSGRALYVGTDGGLSRRAHGSDTWTGLNDGLTNSLINDLDIGRGSEANRAYSYAGFQDQGTQVMKPGFALPRWQKIDGGDNAFVAVDPSDPRHALTSAGFKRTTDGSTITSRAAALKGNPVLLRFDPNVVADVDHKRLYMSAQGHGSGLYVTNDSAATVTLMHDFGAMIVAIAVVRGSSDVMYVATEDNLIWRTSNATEGTAAAWSATTRGPLAPAGGSPVALAIDPRNPNVAVAVYSAFSGVSPPAASRHVWLTTDGNLSWADISGSNAELALNLPDMPLADVVFDSTVEPSAIIVAGEFGVLRSGNHGATWDILARGLPAVQASSLAIDDSRAPALLRVGTYGRSAFELRTDAQVDVALRSEDGRCLEAPDPSNGSAVRMASCTASANQKWTLAPTGELKTLGNKCLDVRGPSSANGTYVQVWDCGDLANQKWHMMTNGNLVGFDNKCLDVDTDTPDGAKVQIWRCLGTREVGIPNQTWSVPPG